MNRFVLLAFISTLALAACAVREPPSGGPEDKDPPRFLNTVPEADSAGLPRDISFTVNFGEKIDGESFKNKIAVYPQNPFDEIKASDSRLEISFQEIFPETTISLYIKKGYMDYHGVESGKGMVFYYSTADSFERGLISGTVKFKNQATEKGIVRIAPLHPDTVDIYDRKEKRTVPADKEGRFVFRYIPADSSGLLIWGFIDENDDGNFSRQREFALVYPDTFYLTEGRPSREGLILNIIDPNEPGEISGEVVNETSIDLRPSVLISPLREGERKHYTIADSIGYFLAKPLKPGRYTLEAFLDISGDSSMSYAMDPADSTRSIREPGISLPDTLEVEPGEKKELDVIIIKKGPGEK
ncbi:MAG: hypothetical protein R6U43_09545 [Candidatus Krumholzibacteriales bacterium]